MSIQFRCSHCNKRMQAPDGAGGKKARCPACGQVIEVPLAAKRELQPGEPGAPTERSEVRDAGWYYQIMGEVTGPLGYAELQSHAQDGRIQFDTLLRKGAQGRWISAGAIKDLFDHELLQNSPPAPLNRASELADRSVAVTTSSLIYTKKAGLGGPFKVYGPIAVIAVGVLLAISLYVRPMSRERMIAKVEPCVAHIRGNISQGTGFLVDSRLLVTNRHVVAAEPDSQIRITFPSNRRVGHESYSATVIFEAPNADLAILELDARLPYLSLASSHHFTRGQDVTVIGNPGLGKEIVLENAVSRGVLSSTARIDGEDYFQLDISVNPGNSGGPVLDSSGRVIGVVTLKAADKEGLGFCIPLAQLTSSVNAAKRLSDDEKRKNSSMHNLRAVTHLLSTMERVYALAMAAYVDAMSESIKRGSSANVGLSTVQPTVDILVSEFDEVIIGKIESEVTRLGADPNIPEPVRQKFVEAWINYRELKSYVESPRGSLVTYRAKYDELADNHERVIETLKLLTGVRE